MDSLGSVTIQMTTFDAILLASLEAVSVAFVIRLWVRKRKLRLFTKLIHTFVLLIPFLGPVFHILIHSHPTEHLKGILPDGFQRKDM